MKPSRHKSSTGADDFLFDIFEVVVIKVEAALEGAVGDTFFALEVLNDLDEEIVKCYRNVPWRVTKQVFSFSLEQYTISQAFQICETILPLCLARQREFCWRLRDDRHTLTRPSNNIAVIERQIHTPRGHLGAGHIRTLYKICIL